MGNNIIHNFKNKNKIQNFKNKYLNLTPNYRKN